MSINPIAINPTEIISNETLPGSKPIEAGVLADSFANILSGAIDAALEADKENPTNLNPLSSSLAELLASSQISFSNPAIFGASNDSYTNIVSEVLNTASKTDTADKSSALDLLMGQTDDLSGLLLDAQKAELSLNLALQIRNKIIDAYNEILRMQV